MCKKYIFLGFIIGVIFSIATIFVFWYYGDHSIVMNERINILKLVAEEELKAREGNSEPLYLGVVLNWEEEKLVSEVRAQFPKTDIRPLSQRIENKCQPMNECDSDNYVKLEVESQPIEIIAFVSYSTPSCGGERLVMKIFGKWHLIAGRTWCA